MDGSDDYLSLDDARLLAQCNVHVYRSSGPGGQHRNKVSSAVRLRHRPTGITTHGDESRSQQDNRRQALRRLRMEIACRRRRRLDPAAGRVPAVVADCVFSPRGPGARAGRQRLQIGRKDHRFWPVAAFCLDLLEAFEGRLADAAGWLDVSTSNLAAVLRSDRHLLAAAQQIRKAHGHKPLT
jgi:hypothetical protein